MTLKSKIWACFICIRVQDFSQFSPNGFKTNVFRIYTKSFLLKKDRSRFCVKVVLPPWWQEWYCWSRGCDCSLYTLPPTHCARQAAAHYPLPLPKLLTLLRLSRSGEIKNFTSFNPSATPPPPAQLHSQTFAPFFRLLSGDVIEK